MAEGLGEQPSPPAPPVAKNSGKEQLTYSLFES